MSDATAIPSARARDKRVADLKALIADAEESLRLTAGHAGQKAAELRERMQRRLAEARSQVAHLQNMAVDRAVDAGHVADDFVHGRPWQAIAVAAGLGIALGLLIGRR